MDKNFINQQNKIFSRPTDPPPKSRVGWRQTNIFLSPALECNEETREQSYGETKLESNKQTREQNYGGTKLESNEETKEESYRETRLESNKKLRRKKVRK